jgi:glycine cleavage system H lipoate-binding protein
MPWTLVPGIVISSNTAAATTTIIINSSTETDWLCDASQGAGPKARDDLQS